MLESGDLIFVKENTEMGQGHPGIYWELLANVAIFFGREGLSCYGGRSAS